MQSFMGVSSYFITSFLEQRKEFWNIKIMFYMTETMEVFLYMTTWGDTDMFVERNVLNNRDRVFKKRETMKENRKYKKYCFQLSKQNN